MIKSMKRLLSVSAAVALGGAMIAAGAADEKKAQVGKPAPDFTLTDYDGQEHTLSSYLEQGNVVVLEWFNHHCPFVKKHYNHESDTMNALVDSWEGEPVVWLRVNSARPTDPMGRAEEVKKAIADWNITTPMLVDAEGKVGRMYGVLRTPEMMVIRPDGVLAYRGAIDNDNSARGPGDVNYVKLAVEAVRAGRPVETAQTESYGCSIKYAD